MRYIYFCICVFRKETYIAKYQLLVVFCFETEQMKFVYEYKQSTKHTAIEKRQLSSD